MKDKRTREQKAQYDVEYIRRHCIKKTLLLNRTKDADIIEWLAQRGGNTNAVIKELIRERMNADD